MDKKNYCKLCKMHVPKSSAKKHETSQRHLRSKARQLFYDRKHGNPSKKAKLDESVQLVEMPGEAKTLIKSEEIIKTNHQMKGVWELMHDEITGNTFYKNNLNGRTVRKRPIGLKDEDLTVTVFQSVQIDHNPIPKREFKQVEKKIDEFTSKVGEWEDTEPTYHFEGEELSQPVVAETADFELIEKPKYQQTLKTSAVFTKRKKKSLFNN